MGLIAFDSGDLDKSIPGLLDGLKTAFFTSLAGMIGSMILSAIIGHKQDEKDGGVSDINQAAGTICQAVQQMSELTKTTIQELASQMKEQEADRKAFYRTVGDILAELKTSQTLTVGTLQGVKSGIDNASSALDSLAIIQRSQSSAIDNIKETSAAMVSSIGNLEEATANQTESIKSVQKSSTEIAEFTHHVPEILDVLSGMSGTQDLSLIHI